VGGRRHGLGLVEAAHRHIHGIRIGVKQESQGSTAAGAKAPPPVSSRDICEYGLIVQK
jgi:hypothetical protein